MVALLLLLELLLLLLRGTNKGTSASRWSPGCRGSCVGFPYNVWEELAARNGIENGQYAVLRAMLAGK